MTPKITILMPCYNGMRYIAEAIDSVIAQSVDEWEFIISDDGSNDGTADYLRSLTDKRIRVHYQAKNLGIFGNLNFLFSNAACPISQILCQDDYLKGTDALQRILAAWQELPKDVAFLRCNFGCDGSAGLRGVANKVLPAIISPKDSDFYFFLFGCIPGNLSNVSVRTPLIEQMGWYRTDLPYAGDFEFWSRTGRVRRWALDKSFVVQVRTHAGQASVTLNKRGELLPQLRTVITGLFENLDAQGYPLLYLRLLATSTYVLNQLDSGLKRGLSGRDWRYLQLVEEIFFPSKCFLGRRLSWLVYIVSLGGRVLTPAFARPLIRRRRSSGAID